jgi:hypothetical protein
VRALLLAITAVLSAHALNAAPDPDDMATTDRAVLSVVAKAVCQRIKTGYAILESNAASGEVRTGEPGLDVVALNQLANRNRSSPRLPRGIGCSTLRVAESSVIHGLSGWEQFRQAFPGATEITQLSLPGYSEDRRVALVVVSGACDWLCGSGFLWELRQVNGGWAIAKTVGLWIS